HMQALEPLLKLQAGQRAHSRHRHISLPRLTRSPNVQISGIERQPLRLVNRHRPGKTKRKLLESCGLRIVAVIPPGERLDRNHLAIRAYPDARTLSALR